MNKGTSSIALVHEYISYYRQLRPRHPIIVGISAVQGCGKTTLTNGLCSKYENEGLKAVAISLDDFYLPRNRQDELAKTSNNPLLAYRGNAGTHDVELLNRTLHALRQLPTSAVFRAAGSSKQEHNKIFIPTFDKSQYSGLGDRAPPAMWTLVEDCIDVVLVEGWMLGFSHIDANEISSKCDLNAHLYDHTYNFKSIVSDYPGYEQVNTYMKQYEELNMLMDIWVILALEITHITVDDYKLLSAWTIPESEESSDMLESKNVPETLEDIIYHWRREAEYKMIQNMSNSSAASCPEVKGMSDEKLREFVSKFMPAYYCCLPLLYCIDHPRCGPIRQQLRTEYQQHRMALPPQSEKIRFEDVHMKFENEVNGRSEAKSAAKITADSNADGDVTPNTELAPVLKIYVDKQRCPYRAEYC